MSEALSLTKIKLSSLQGFLCALPVSDVLDGTEHLVGSARRISFHISLAVHATNFPGGTDDSVFSVRASSATNSLLRFSEHILTIFRVNHFPYCRQVYRAVLRRQPIDT